VAGWTDARVEGCDTASFMSTNSLFDSHFCFWVVVVVEGIVIVFEVVVVGILRVSLTDMMMVGTVPVPVAFMIACSTCSRSHQTISPSDL
jgi:hypothetical protein